MMVLKCRKPLVYLDSSMSSRALLHSLFTHAIASIVNMLARVYTCYRMCTHVVVCIVHIPSRVLGYSVKE